MCRFEIEFGSTLEEEMSPRAAINYALDANLSLHIYVA